MSDVPAPINSDGRYHWTGSANGITVGGPISFVGDLTLLVGTASLTWTILQRASDGSQPVLSYSTDGLTTTSVPLGSEGTPQETVNENGQINIALAGAVGFAIDVTSGGGAPTIGATPWQVGVAITRNSHEVMPWDAPNPLDPIGYNFNPNDAFGYRTDTLLSLRVQVMTRLGFANQATNPPPGMTALVNNFLYTAQRFLYRRYTSLHQRRFFRWKLIPGQRMYSLGDHDESPSAIPTLEFDPTKPVEWAGIQDTRNVWYPLIRGIPPQLYTMVTKPWRPARYDIRQGIEVYPMPDQTYFLWIKGMRGLQAFVGDSDVTSIDCDLVFLEALALAKAHYGHPDANNIAAMANAYRGELIAGTHQTAHYVPGTIAVPPAVRPTLIQFDTTGSGA